MQFIRYGLLIFLLSTIPGSLYADNREQYSIDQVAAQLKKGGAEILSAEVLQGNRQGIVYRFKIKNQGRIRVIVMRPDGTRVE